MANVRDSDTSLWLHNKLGTSNDSWISGSICTQLNKEVLRNIKECFADLQTQVKLKLLLSLFHIPRRLVEEWKTELEEVIEVAGLDSELWVSMLAESMKTFPATSSLNTEISDYEDTRPIFTDMVNDLRKLVAKHSDLGMLPLECQYLNKNALISVVGQQAPPIKHFTLKRKPKSNTLRTELLHKSADAQSSLKKTSAPMIPLRSRGMPRKMTDTTPLKGIPSRMPTSGFRSPNVNPVNHPRPNLSRTPAGRKDGGIKLIEFTDQPIGYVAAKKRKREQQLEEQAKRQEQKAAAAAAAAAANVNNATANHGQNNNQANNSNINNSVITANAEGSSEDVNNGVNTNGNEDHGNTSIMEDGADLNDTVNTTGEEASGQQIVERQKPINIGEHEDEVIDIDNNDKLSVQHKQITNKTSTPEYAPPPLSYTTKNPNLMDIDGGNLSGVEEDIVCVQNSNASTSITTAIGSNVTSKKGSAKLITNKMVTSATNISGSGKESITGRAVGGTRRLKRNLEVKNNNTSSLTVGANIIKVEKLSPLQNRTISLVQQQQQDQQLQQQQQQLDTPVQHKILLQQQHQQEQQQNLPVLEKTSNPQVASQSATGNTSHVIIRTAIPVQKQTLTTLRQQNNPIKMEKLGIKPIVRSVQISQPSAIRMQQQQTSSVRIAGTNTVTSGNPLANLPNNISVKITSAKGNRKPVQTIMSPTSISQQQPQQQHQQSLITNQQPQKLQQQQIIINNNTPVILSSSSQAATLRQKQMAPSNTATTLHNAIPQTSQTIKSMPLSQLKKATNSGPVIISQTIIQPAKRTNISNNATPASQTILGQQPQQQQQQQHSTNVASLPQQQSQTQIVQTITGQQQQVIGSGPATQYILTQSSSGQQLQQPTQTIPTISTYTPSNRPTLTAFQTTSNAVSGGIVSATTSSAAKIQLLKATPTIPGGVVIRQQPQTINNQQQIVSNSGGSGASGPTLLNIQNVQLPNRPVTIQPASQAAQQQHLQAQLQQQQHTLVSNNTATQQPKLTQVLMQSSGVSGVSGAAPTLSSTGASNSTNVNSMKNKTIILTQKGVILRNIVGDMYEQIPISSVSGLQALSAVSGTSAISGGSGTTLMSTATGPPGLVKTTNTILSQPQTITLQPPNQLQTSQTQITKTQLPALIPTQQHVIVQQPQHVTSTLIANQPAQQTIIRPMMTSVQSGLTNLPSGLTLIQRPGQQPQFVQVQTTGGGQPSTLRRTIIAQPAVIQQQSGPTVQTATQLRPQQILLQHKAGATTSSAPRLIATSTGIGSGQTQQIQLQRAVGGNNQGGTVQRIIQIQPTQQQQQHSAPAPQRKGLSLSNEHVHKAHEMFRKANRVSRPDKALILGFMAGLRENPRPNSENVIVIKLGETEEKVQQEDGNTALCLVESHIRLDYNTGEWKTFQNYRRLDQTMHTSNDNTAPSSNVIQSTNSVAI